MEVWRDGTDDLGLSVSLLRRKGLVGVRPAIIGFQYGRCFYCHDPLPADLPAHIDHVFPWSRMSRPIPPWPGPDLDQVWNFVVACTACNLRKSDRWPTTHEVKRLDERNEAIIQSPFPLKVTIRLQTGQTPAQRRSFLQSTLSTL